MKKIRQKQISDSWLKFVDSFFRNERPRLAHFLQKAEIIAEEGKDEILINVFNSAQKLWILDWSKRELVPLLVHFGKEYPGLDEVRIFMVNAYENKEKTLLKEPGPIQSGDLSEDLLKRMDNSRNSVSFEDALQDNRHTNVCKELAVALCNEDYPKITSFLGEEVRMTSYKKKTVIGKDEFVKYWRWFFGQLKENHMVADFNVKHNTFCDKTIIAIRQRDFFEKSTAELYLSLCIKYGILIAAIITPKQQQDYLIRYYDLDHPALDYDKIMSRKKKKIQPEPNRMPCLCCGRPSEKLKWYIIDNDSGPYGHIGQTSVCPHCKRQAEFYPEIFYRNE